jgi:hypothetical protein
MTRYTISMSASSSDPFGRGLCKFPQASLDREHHQHGSDEVDHSLWTLDGCTWERARIAPNDPGNPNKRILLKVPCRVQGVANCFYNFGYQVVATGDLYQLPTATEVSVDPSELIPPQ